MKLLRLSFVLVAALLFNTVHAAPMDFSFTGNFSNDDDVAFFDFSIAGAATNVTLQTLGYAGGTNSDGDNIAAGGFDPILSLFDSSGLLLFVNDDNLGGAIDPATNAAFDSLLDVLLAPGDYTLALSQYDNFAVGPALNNGFSGAATTGYVDFTGDTRTSFFAVDILNVESAAQRVPEPTILWLFGAGLAGLGFVRRKTT